MTSANGLQVVILHQLACLKWSIMGDGILRISKYLCNWTYTVSTQPFQIYIIQLRLLAIRKVLIALFQNENRITLQINTSML